MTLKAAYMMDTAGNKAARAEIAMIKVVAPNVALRVLDRSIQAHGGAGVFARYFSRQLAAGPTFAPCDWPMVWMKCTRSGCQWLELGKLEQAACTQSPSR